MQRILKNIANYRQMKKIVIITLLMGLSLFQVKAQSAGDIITYNEKQYTLGENIITNPSFNNGLSGWNAGDGSALASTGFTVNATGGCDNGAYLVGTLNKGNADAGSLATGWTILPNTDYYFCISIKQLGTGSDTQYLITTLTNGMTSEDNTENRLYGSGSATYTTKFGNYQLTAGEWHKNEAIFNSGSFTYCQCRFRWLNDQFGFDNFYLAPVTEATDETIIVVLQKSLADLQVAAEEMKGSDELDGLQGLANELGTAIQESKSYNESADKETLETSIATLQAAMSKAQEGVKTYSTLASLMGTMNNVLATTDYAGKEKFSQAIDAANLIFTATDTSLGADFLNAISQLNDAFYTYFYSHEITVVSPLTVNGEYFIYNTYYNRIIGSNAAETAPALSYLGTQADTASYVWVVEASDNDGYYYLRQKSSNKYMVCSTSNTWSMTFASTIGTANTYLWSIDASLEGTIGSPYNSKYLGCDAGAESQDYISFYYDKSTGELSTWQLLDANSASVDEGRVQRYLNQLAAAIASAKSILNNESMYNAEYVAKVNEELKSAMVAYATCATIDKLSELSSVTTALQEAISACYANSATSWASGSDFSIGNSYTVALNDVKLTEDAGASVTLFVQNSTGMGLTLTLTQSEVKAGDNVLLQNLTDATQSHNYQIAVNGNEVVIYRDGNSLGSLSTYSILIGSEAELAVAGEDNLASYAAEIISFSQALEPGSEYINSHGKAERYIVKANGAQLTLDKAIDLHLTAATGTAPFTNTVISLNHEDAWVIFDNVLPSEVISTYLKSLRINDATASNGSNLRVAIYLNGAAVMPHSSSYQAFYGYDEENCAGNETSYKAGTYTNLGTAANTFRSFILKRGYMVTLASTPDGGTQDGTSARTYSRVYVADHEDIQIDVIPESLNQRISFISLRKWQYNSKKGWATTGSSASACKQVRTGWCYSWSAGYSSGSDYEYVPMKGHLYWPSWSEVNGKTASNHVLSYNEPEHSEQHESADCSCGGTISEWSAFSNSVEILGSGMRIGSPAPTDAGYLTNFIGYCDAYHRRCDFVTYHYYGTSISSLKSTLASIHEKTGRPIWITEAEYGDSWGDTPGYTDYTSAAAKVKELMDLFESLDYVERYVIYNWDLWYNMLINYENWVTPAGQVYRDYKSKFAYNAEKQFVSPWWRPGVQDVSLTGSVSSEKGEIAFTAKNPNEDITDKMIIQYKNANGVWENVYEETARHLFDNESNTLNVSYESLPVGEHSFRLHVTTLYGDERNSSEISLTIPETNYIRTVSGNQLSVTAHSGLLTISATKNETINVYSLKGELIEQVHVTAGTTSFLSLPAGTYVVQHTKVVIKK